MAEEYPLFGRPGRCSSARTQLLDDSQNFNTSIPASQNEMHAAIIKQDTPQWSRATRVLSYESDASVPKGQWKKVAYPFELVKPGGVEGETTLKDINHQMLMNPSKPIPHAVGDSAAHPFMSARRLGMSGKAVVALTGIQTQGRGSITIIRTKG